MFQNRTTFFMPFATLAKPVVGFIYTKRLCGRFIVSTECMRQSRDIKISLNDFLCRAMIMDKGEMWKELFHNM